MPLFILDRCRGLQPELASPLPSPTLANSPGSTVEGADQQAQSVPGPLPLARCWS